MGTYEKNMIDSVIKSSRDGYYKIKITGSDGETNWMNITKNQLLKIKRVLS